MKLSYIWVKEFKGFKNQGFNFATDFTFDYSPTNSRLTKTENPKYIRNFFGSEITDVKGIIGRNASGKTNILELIQYIYEGANTIINQPFLVVFNKDNRFIVYQYKLKILTDFEAETKIEDYPKGKIPEINSIFFSNVFDGRRHNFGKSVINISINDLLNFQFGESVNKNYQKTIQQQIRFINSDQFNLLERVERSLNKSETVNLKPSKVVITSPTWSSIIHKVKAFEKKLSSQINDKLYLRDLVLSFRRKITDSKSITSIKYLTAFLVFIDFILNPNSKDKNITDNQDIHFYRELGKSLKEINADSSNIDEIFDYFTTKFAELIFNQKPKQQNIFEITYFLGRLKYYKFEDHANTDFKENVGTYSNRKVQFTLNYDDFIGQFLTEYLDAVTHQNLSYNIDWAGISSGHKAYINLFANFYSIIPRVNEKSVLICIDEGDLYFHPKWQTEFLYKLIKVLPDLIGKPCQLFLTTHSPFLVSDLPKSNLMFVEKDKNDELRVIPNNEIEGETFGGNIGELYIDAFFMQGSLISRFAESKIQNIINRLRDIQGQITSVDRIVIEEIGDELIRGQLNKLANDKS